MNDICFELSSSWQSDFDTTPIKLQRIRHRQRLPPLFLRKLRGKVRENVGQVANAHRLKHMCALSRPASPQPFDIQHHIVISSPLCVFLESKLNVQANRIGSRNGQSPSEPEQSKPRGRFTGERLLRERPRVYRKVVELLADPGMSINQITKLCRVSEHTVRALRDREAISIAERKQR